MRCERCGFELEPGQTFCSMCGTEQSRAARKKKFSPKSILWVIKVASKNHLKMWLVFIATLVMSAFILGFMDRESPLVISSLCLLVLLLAYQIYYVLLGYRNPNATKTKAYKLRYRALGILAVLLLLFTVFMDFNSLTASIHELINKYN